MSEQEVLPQGRRVRLEPTPPGLSPLILGVVIAALAPLFGFLIGSLMGPADDGATFLPIYWGLFGGVVIGGIGLVIALVGGMKLWRHTHRKEERPADEA